MRRSYPGPQLLRLQRRSLRAAVVAMALWVAVAFGGAAPTQATATPAAAGAQANTHEVKTPPTSCSENPEISAPRPACPGPPEIEPRAQDADERALRLRCMIHECRRDDARCIAELVTKVAYPIALIVASATGVPHEVLEALRTIASR